MIKTFCDGCGTELGLGGHRQPAAATGETSTKAPYPVPTGRRFHFCGGCLGVAFVALRDHASEARPTLTDLDDALRSRRTAPGRHYVITDPKPVEPTGDPKVDALIDALVCPTCRTIWNAAKAKCSDPWHYDNQPAAPPPAGPRGPVTVKSPNGPFDSSAIVVDTSGSLERLAVLLHERFRPLAGDVLIFDDCEQIAQMAVVALKHDERAAYDRGLAEGREPIVEHAIQMSGGGMHIRYDDPEIDDIYPLAKWIPNQQRFGGKVWRRTVIVVDDWTEVPPAEEAKSRD